jgi:2-hydroxychromene-2-carboxylate isomerase
VSWKPILLGAAFKKVGTAPLTTYPLKGEYSKHDFQRTARMMGVTLDLPDGFPHMTLSAARAFYWAEKNAPEKARDLATAFFKAYFTEGLDIGQPDVVGAVAAKVGLDAQTVVDGIQQPEIKDQLKEVTNDAVENRGVFGAPFFFVDGEPFWGCDRLDQLEKWLETGGW